MRGDQIQRRVDAVRAHSSELENHVIDEYRAGYIGRRDFIKRATVVGMSLSTAELPCGRVRHRARRTRARRNAGAAGGRPTSRRAARFKSGLQLPGSDLDPIKVNNQGALGTLGQSGEFLIYSDSRPDAGAAAGRELEAERRRLRVDVQDPPGREVPDGKPMTAEDVAATFNLHADPDNGSNALSAFTGVLSKGGAQATDDDDRRVRARRAERQLPVHDLLGQLQR